MFLKKLAIINYKCCKDLVLEFSDKLPNTFIGRTDSGKSTILNAIGLLLDNKACPNLIEEGRDTSDVSTTPLDMDRYKNIFKELEIPFFDSELENSIILIGIFNKEPGDFEENFNENASNHLKWSIESLPQDELPIIRHFNNQYPGGRYLLCAKDNKAKKAELWKQTQKTLGSYKKELSITDGDVTNDNKAGRYKNIELFRAIYNRLNTNLQWSDYDNFAKKDKEFFPTYRYIDWREITLKGVEGMAKDTMSTVIDEYGSKLKEKAETLSREATDKVNSELEKKITDIISELSSITSIEAKVYFDANSRISEITVKKGTSDGNVRLESQGEGIKKQIGFAFMRLAALENIKKGAKAKKFLWAFDEPEVHLYPPEKREFYNTIKQLSESIFQTFISTHSTVFVDKSILNTIMQVQLANKYTSISKCSSVPDIYKILGIKNSDFLFYDFFIAGEGASEEVLIPHFYNLYFGKSIEEDSIQIINLGGDSRWKENKKLFEQILKDFKNPDESAYYILDNDTGVQENNVFLVGKFDIEDSIDDKYWIDLVKDQCGLILNNSDLKGIRKSLAKNSDKKFHKLLMDKVFSYKERTKTLPSKKNCALYMVEAITEKKDIPADIIKLFKEIESNNSN